VMDADKIQEVMEIAKGISSERRSYPVKLITIREDSEGGIEVSMEFETKAPEAN
jgi:hypothetical protein